jgi:hypothetical protein
LSVESKKCRTISRNRFNEEEETKTPGKKTSFNVSEIREDHGSYLHFDLDSDPLRLGETWHNEGNHALHSVEDVYDEKNRLR